MNHAGKNILYLTYGPQSGVVERLVTALSERGFEIEATDLSAGLHYKSKNGSFPKISGFSVLNVLLSIRLFGILWKERYFRTPLAFKTMTRRAERAVKQNAECSIILQTGTCFAPSFGTLDRPFVMGILDNTYMIGKKTLGKAWLPPVGEELERAIYLRAAKIFVASQYVKRSLVLDYGIPEDRVLATGFGPNVNPPPESEPHLCTERIPKIVFIGLFFFQKGGETLLQAFEIVRRQIKDAELVIIGREDERNIPGVRFVGRLELHEVAEQLSGASLFVMPSYYEPFGIAFLDAMICGLPCIGTSVGAAPEIIADGETGFIVPPNHPEALAEKICTILSSPDLAAEMGRRGRKRVEERYSWDKIGDMISEELAGLLQ